MAEKAKSKKAKTVAKKKVSKIEKKPSAAKAAIAKKAKAKPVVAKKSSGKKTAERKVVAKDITKKVDEINLLESPPLEEKFFEQDVASSEIVSQSSSEVVSVVAESSKSATVSQLNINLSQSLIKKLTQQAEEEGIPLTDFISELLSESVVLRAWEIVERKNQMRSMPTQNMNNRSGNAGNNSNQHRNNRNNNSNNKQGGRGGMSHGRYQSIMDDKATFLEYVRNQEKTRR